MARPLALLAAAIAVAAPHCAEAQVAPATAQAVLKLACTNVAAGAALSRERLAEALLAQNQALPSDIAFVARPTLPERLQAIGADDRLRAPGGSATLDETVSRLRRSLFVLERDLYLGNLKEAALEGRPPARNGWLFAAGGEGAQVKCLKATEAPAFETVLEEPRGQAFVLRQKPEELAITGAADRKKAGSFSLGLNRVWKEKDDGSRVEETTLKIDGTAGLRLPLRSENASAFAFAQYNLDRLRKDPAPPLEPDERIDEDDTNVLALGILGESFARLPGRARGSASFTGQAAYVTDFADESERLRASLLVGFPFGADLGFCRLGSATDGELGARCLIEADGEAGLWLDDGLSTTRSYDDFLALGGRATYELFYRTGEKSELLGGVTYRYLPVVTGTLDDIERLEITLKHRLWAPGGFGIDAGFEYKVGTNALSLKHEKSLGFSFGVIY